jgi:hypothetical protein
MRTNQMESEVGPRREQEELRRKAKRNKKVGAVAAAAAIGLVAVAWILATRGEQDAGTPPNEAAGATAEEVATGFLEAYGAFDADRAYTYLADDADISGLGVVGTQKEFRRFIAWLEAEGYKQMLDPCEELASSPSGTLVRCAFDFHALGSDQIGLGPYSGSTFLLNVRDGEIVRASLSWDIDEFSPQMWEPFAEWVSATYPRDFAVMYTDGGSNFRLTEESIRLWERHTRQYVDEVAQGA